MKSAILRGTFILTIAGFISRLIGFYYRIFLSNAIGAEGMGLFQLVTPIIGISFALCCAGIQTSVSKYVASSSSSKNHQESPSHPSSWLISGLLISLPMSLIIASITYTYSDFIATRILLTSNVSPLIKLLSFSLPLASFHSCVNGYYLGFKKAGVPAFSQLFEQIVRVLCVYLVIVKQQQNYVPVTAIVAIYGVIAGEFGSSLFCIISLTLDKKFRIYKDTVLKKSKEVFKLSVPLTTNRVLLHLFQSGEAILIPAQLMVYGLNNSEALSVYGTLTGMALPLILFPATITNSASVMLLPTVSNAQSSHNTKTIVATINSSIKFCLIMGIFSTGIFIIYGAHVGSLLFHNSSVDTFVTVLSWLCPFLYMATTLGSILNGLGKTGLTCIQNIIGIAIRITFLILLVPRYGIMAYLWGLLVSQIFVCVAHLYELAHTYTLNIDPIVEILLPVVWLILSIGISLIIYVPLHTSEYLPEILCLTIGAFVCCIIYCGLNYMQFNKSLT